MNIIAHRGVFNNTTIPENSMKAFQKALKSHYDIELDVQLTTDHTLVVFHDASLKRMTENPRILQDCSYHELQSLTLLNTKEKIPTLKEVLSLVNDQVLLDIEIKNTKNISDTCDLLMEELNPYHNYIIKSFNPKIVRYLKKHYPNHKIGYLIDQKYRNRFYQILLPSKWMIHYSKADFLAIHKSLISTKKYQTLKRKYPIYLWTIKKEDSYSSDDYGLICNDLI